MNIHSPFLATPVQPNGHGLAGPPEGEADLWRLSRTLWQGRRTVVFGALLGVVVALAVWAERAPGYTASLKVLLEGASEPFAKAQPEPALARERADAVQTLSSTALAAAVVDDLGLATPGAYFVAQRISLPAFFVPGRTAEADDGRRRSAVARNIAANIAFSPVKGSAAVRINVTAPRRGVAQRIAAILPDVYARHREETAINKTRALSIWLGEKAAALGEDVRAKELAVEQAEAALALGTGAATDTADTTADAAVRTLPEARAALAQAREHLAVLDARHARLSVGDAAAAVDLAGAAAVARLEREAGHLVALEAHLAAVAPRHPRRTNLPAQIAGVRGALARELQILATGVKADREAAARRVETLKREVRALETRTVQQREAAVDVRVLGREAAASRTLHEAVLTRLEESAASPATGARLTVLSPAEGARRAGPALSGVLALALMVGAFAGAGVTLTRENLRKSILSEADVAGPVLATLPLVAGNPSPSTLLFHMEANPDGALAEAVRQLRTSLMVGDHAPQTIAFCAPESGEGATTTALLFALTAHQMGKRTVIVDCDLRRRTLSSLVKSDHRRPDLSAVMAGRATVEAAVMGTGPEILFAHPMTRRDGPSAADRLASDGFSQLLSTLSARYDCVVLDCPPVRRFADARIVGPKADRVVMVAQVGLTTRPSLSAAVRAMEGVSAPVCGLVLTAAPD
ncbi:MAG: AAA family ATPase [Pseudomonadota bacterium]